MTENSSKEDVEFFRRAGREERIAAENEADARKRAQRLTLAEQYESAAKTYEQLEATTSDEVDSSSNSSTKNAAKRETFLRF